MKTVSRVGAHRLLWSIAVLAVAVAVGLVWSQPRVKSNKASTEGTTTWHGLEVYPQDANLSFPITHTDAQWKQILTSEQYYILRQAGTERPFSGSLLNVHEPGIFYSAATGEPLFRTSAKFESGTGWPSFYEPIRQSNVILRWDNSFGMPRVEVIDSASGSHLGHLFDDGPKPTGLRYCMDSDALLFVPKGGTAPAIVQKYLQAHPDSAAVANQ